MYFLLTLSLLINFSTMALDKQCLEDLDPNLQVAEWVNVDESEVDSLTEYDFYSFYANDPDSKYYDESSWFSPEVQGKILQSPLKGKYVSLNLNKKLRENLGYTINEKEIELDNSSVILFHKGSIIDTYRNKPNTAKSFKLFHSTRCQLTPTDAGSIDINDYEEIEEWEKLVNENSRKGIDFLKNKKEDRVDFLIEGLFKDSFFMSTSEEGIYSSDSFMILLKESTSENYYNLWCFPGYKLKKNGGLKIKNIINTFGDSLISCNKEKQTIPKKKIKDHK
ncbi:hypothetical protein N9N67_09115 [Bacteriovoracaceae bacterium]|nr:hypothetical protein [Bacteriovoracaceae bacterium]